MENPAANLWQAAYQTQAQQNSAKSTGNPPRSRLPTTKPPRTNARTIKAFVQKLEAYHPPFKQQLTQNCSWYPPRIKKAYDEDMVLIQIPALIDFINKVPLVEIQ